MEMVVKSGKRYVPAEKNKVKDQPIGVISIDSIFSPIRKVNYVVTNARVGQVADYDKLTLEVWTDGTVIPEDAVAYAAKIMKIKDPKVGLLANGSEESKGNELTKATFPLLKALDGFIGNVEGKDIFNGKVNVVVCDGFTGNILLKTSEGVVSTVFDLMKQHIRKSLPAKIGALMMKKKVFGNMKKQVDKDEYGGAPLLGLKGCAIISHGASSPKAIKNAVFQAISYVESDVNATIEKLLSESK